MIRKGKKLVTFSKIFLENERGEFGIGTIISIAIGLIITSFIIIPGLEGFAQLMMDDMAGWWTNTVSNKLFP